MDGGYWDFAVSEAREQGAKAAEADRKAGRPKYSTDNPYTGFVYKFGSLADEWDEAYRIQWGDECY